ncbi:hypothetical protein SUGI_0445030 [Cryptomeria japonica]|nr:hypothetical protein SUGI_0445030 [Cryptomeria japonica]
MINIARSNLQDFCFFTKWGGGNWGKGCFKTWCRSNWGEDININILPNGFFMIEFMKKEDKWKAMNKGPYFLDGIEVHIIEWQPNFNPQNHHLPGSRAWIRFYNCPSDYWHIDIIKDICKSLRSFVSVDDIMEDKLWGSFIRVCINTVHVFKILEEIKIMGTGKIWIQKIDREDQLHICPKCFSLDHVGLDYEVMTTILKSHTCMQFSIEEELQSEPPKENDPILDEVDTRVTNQDKTNFPLIEAIPVNSAPPSVVPQNQDYKPTGTNKSITNKY